MQSYSCSRCVCASPRRQPASPTNVEASTAPAAPVIVAAACSINTPAATRCHAIPLLTSQVPNRHASCMHCTALRAKLHHSYHLPAVTHRPFRPWLLLGSQEEARQVLEAQQQCMQQARQPLHRRHAVLRGIPLHEWQLPEGDKGALQPQVH